MKKLLILIVMACVVNLNAQQNRKTIVIPDIPGYITLKCDLHMHTVFSDGQVWPNVRVEEAWLDGLDVISITDHLEYIPHKNDLVINRNRSYDIAKEAANQMNIILIKGAEVTHEYPYGHFNCFFIQDAEALNKEKPLDQLMAAKSQNAVFQWNHPGWLQPGEIPLWYDFQQTAYDQKMMNMIEIVNETSYYPLAHQWAIDKNLAITANSDIHQPIYMSYGAKIHRPITLVFAKERSESGVRESLLAARTAVYHFDTIMGKEEFLKPLFHKSLVVKTQEIVIKGKQWIDLILENISDVPLMISFKGGSDEFLEVGSGIYVPAHGAARATMKGKKEDFTGEKNYTIPCVIDNYYVGPRVKLKADIQFKVRFEKKGK